MQTNEHQNLTNAIAARAAITVPGLEIAKLHAHGYEADGLKVAMQAMARQLHARDDREKCQNRDFDTAA